MRPSVAFAITMLVGCTKKTDEPPKRSPETPSVPQGSGKAPPPAPSGPNAANIEKLTGAKGKLDDKSGVLKVSVPRKDLAVTIAGTVKMTPPMGLTAWAAFQKMGDHDMVMGDIVLTEDQVNPVMNAALDSGLEVTALHNHFLWDNPKIMFMHIGGMADE